MGVSRDCPNFLSTPYYLRNGYKATNFKFRRCIHSVHANKSPLKIREKRKRGRIQGLPNFFQYPLLSQERVKLRTSNFVCTFDRSQQKSITDFGKSSRSSQDSKFSRSPIYWAHRAVVFATAQLSCKPGLKLYFNVTLPFALIRF